MSNAGSNMGSSQNVNDTTMRGPTHRAAIKFAKMGKWQFKFLLKTSDTSSTASLIAFFIQNLASFSI
jgi:hypothetical protein